MHPKRAAGLTLTEVIVAGSILLLLSAIFAVLFKSVQTNSEGGSVRIAMRADHRESQKRLTLLLRRCMAPNELDPAIVSPEYEESGTEIVFHAPPDLLDPAGTFEPRNPSYPEFTLRHVGKELHVARSDGSGPTQSIGRDLDMVEFLREHKRTIRIRLSSIDKVGEKIVEETSENVVRLPGVR